MAQFSTYPRVSGGSNGQKTMVASAPVVIASDQSAILVTATQFPSSLGAKTIANSTAVNIASDQTVPVSGTFWQATQPVSGTVAATQSGTWNITNISGTISLPTGAATSANQTTANTSLSSIDTKTPALGQALAAGSVPVVLTASQLSTLTPLSTVAVTGTFWQATQPVSGTVAATQSGTWNGRTQDGSGNNITSSLVGSNRGIHDFQLGYSSANSPVRNDYTVTSVTTSAYTQLVASLTSECQSIEIFDSSGQTLKLATGGAGSEVDQILIFPGGNGRVKLRIASGTRVSVKAVSATASVGELDINFYG